MPPRLPFATSLPSALRIAAFVAVMASVTATGCARQQDALARQRQATHAAIAAAEAMGSGLTEDAGVALARARQQAHLGERLGAHGQHEVGRRLLHRAEVDAALALTMAREAPARALAQDAVDQLEATGTAQTGRAGRTGRTGRAFP